jgi:hypothetical protein
LARRRWQKLTLIANRTFRAKPNASADRTRPAGRPDHPPSREGSQRKRPDRHAAPALFGGGERVDNADPATAATSEHAIIESGVSMRVWPITRTVEKTTLKAAALGTDIREGVRVTRVSRDGANWRVVTNEGSFHAPHIVIAAGAWADRIANLGEPVPLEVIARC